MPRNVPFKISPHQKSSRSSASSRSRRAGSSRSSTNSRRSTARSTLVVSAGRSRSHRQTTRVSVVQSSSRTSPSDAQQGELDAEHDDTNDDTLNEIVMAVDMTARSTVGCSYYVAREEKLYFMEDLQVGNADIVDTCERELVRKVRAMLTYYSKKVHRSYSHSRFDED